MPKRIAAAALLLVTAVSPAQATLLIDHLDPVGGALYGAPGEVVGWGFSVTNDSSTQWLMLTASDFSPGPGWWTYTDFLAANAILLAPNATATQVFSAVGLTGSGSFLIDALANPGDTVAGAMVLTYDGFDGNPLQGGANQDLFSATAEIAASVTVREPVTAPEPSTAALLAFALAAALRRRPTDTDAN
jgi:hypothetical protein